MPHSFGIGTIEKDMGGSPVLVVMGGDSSSEGCGFGSKYRTLDGPSYINLL